MSSSASETDPLIRPQVTIVAQRTPKFAWLVPVVLLASISRGISMFARYEYYQSTFCPDSNYTCGWFERWLELPSITVQMQMWSMFASFVVSFVSVGWWSELGDRRGRRIVLFCSISGALLVDLIYLIVASVPSLHEDPLDSLSLGLIIEGLLGGFATYTGVAHAYTFDVAPTPLFRLLLFGALNALSLVGFILGAIIGNSTRNNVAYILSIVFALLNLAFIYAILPESLKPNDNRPVAPQRAVLKTIVSPFSVFFRGPQSRRYLPLLALSFYIYSLAQNLDVSIIFIADRAQYLTIFPRWLLLSVPRVINLATLLCILPAIAWLFKRTHGDTNRAATALATAVAQNSILVAALSCMGVLVFCLPARSPLLYALFTIMHPFTVAAGPALYALGAQHFLALGRAHEIGALFGALSVWGALAQYVSFTLYPGFEPPAFFFIVSLVLLMRDAPPAPEEEAALDSAGDAARV
ncbi:hypothetical protein DFH07DRAFT_1061285 [Mycena maculata]|uniref:MFS general substrate transporter n=1 Tax=Mycena maculata TaxID=230809 RepID=A0AAD7J4C8_9AGAR|nr:hypothetical protein DFH07DRAFT_1061285 [Mycena maculata]